MTRYKDDKGYQGHSIYFNFCHYTDLSQCENEHEIQDNFAYRIEPLAPGETHGECAPLTSNAPLSDVIEDRARPSLSNPEETQEGVRIMRAGGVECPEDPSYRLSLTLDIWCNPAYTGNPQDVAIRRYDPKHSKTYLKT